MTKLTPKQQNFIDFYIELGNGTEAAIKAGYSAKTARTIAADNLAKPYIREAVDARLAELQSARIADQREILEYLTSIIRGEQTEQVLQGTGGGAQKISKMAVNAANRVRAAELLGKRHALWTDKQQIEGTVPVTIVNDLDD